MVAALGEAMTLARADLVPVDKPRKLRGQRSLRIPTNRPWIKALFPRGLLCRIDMARLELLRHVQAGHAVSHREALLLGFAIDRHLFANPLLPADLLGDGQHLGPGHPC